MSVRPAYLFHTAFCCSTLLARCLAQPGRTFLLIEPLALRDLADAARRGPVEDETVQLVLRLLSKPQGNEDRVLIKPSNLANNLAGRLLAADARARAVVISSDLEDFIVSFIKKPDDTKRKMPWLLATLSQGTDYLEHLGVDHPERLDFWKLSALIWHVQRHLLSGISDQRLRSVTAGRLLESPRATVTACARHLGLRMPTAPHLQKELNRHAKSLEVKYDAARRRQEAEMVRSRFGASIRQTVDWFRQDVEPRMPVALPVPIAAEDEDEIEQPL